jgi:hypothetical protein
MSNPPAFNPKDRPMPLDFFLNRYGISRTTAWRWRKRGLPVSQVGAKIFCRESDFVRFLESGGNSAQQQELTQ